MIKDAFLLRLVIYNFSKMASNLREACFEEPAVARVTRSGTKRNLMTSTEKSDKCKQKTTRDDNESSKVMVNFLRGDSVHPTTKSLKLDATGQSNFDKKKNKKQDKFASMITEKSQPSESSKYLSVKSDSSEKIKSTPKSQHRNASKDPKQESPKFSSSKVLTEPDSLGLKSSSVGKSENLKKSKESKRKIKDSQPSNGSSIPSASGTIKSEEEHCQHFQENDDKLPEIKNGISKSKKTGSKINKSKGDGWVKPELMIPEIVIPVDKKKILRKDGPSPWNGSIKYDNKIFLGAHISAAGGLENAISNSVKIGGSSFALFLKNQRQWVSKPMEASTVERFKAACAAQDFPPHLILPHGSYLMNCGSSDPAILSKSRATLLDEVQRCERLGILYYNIHPGSTCGKGSREEAIQNIADSINWVHDQTPGSEVAVVLENMCRQGHTIGGDFAELAKIIELVFDQSRVGVCLDTCHALAAGYDLASSEGFEAFLEEFERVIGFRYLVAVHLNDSEGALGCHRDRHASIGKGHIGLEGFRRIINCPRFRDIPVVLETPFISDDFYKKEILLLKSLAESETVCA